MRKMIVSISILGVLLLTVASAGPAFAEGDSPPEGERPLREYVVVAFAEALGLDPIDVQSRLDAGERLYAIAAEHGIEGDDFKALMSEVTDKALALAVSDGGITQETADRIRTRYENREDRWDDLRRRWFREKILDRLGVTREELANLRESGMTLGEIAASLGVEISRPFKDGGIFERLGLTREEIRERREAGETIREILESEGFDFSDFGDRTRRNRR